LKLHDAANCKNRLTDKLAHVHLLVIISEKKSVLTICLGISLLVFIDISQLYQNTSYSQTPQANVTNIIQDKFADLVSVNHEGQKRVVLLFYETESTYGWQAIELLESQYGYHMDSLLSSGMGSQGNPTRFFAVLSRQ
jgi:hypothetical protein